MGIRKTMLVGAVIPEWQLELKFVIPWARHTSNLRSGLETSLLTTIPYRGWVFDEQFGLA